ncbi:hypothetical protein HY469_01120 [Candidatus Roizmanbacteria bacterium]|nr:hypothetical protein [Candidatus Roizmanbacteria bacterium]
MSKEFRVRKASHVGRGHLLDFVNRQDSHVLFEGELNNKRTIVGIVCDGCSEGTFSEVGANLASNFLVREVARLLKQGVPLSIVPTVVYTALVNFLQGILLGFSFVNPSDRVSFIKNNLLFTVVGFILNEEEATVFLAGDGVIVINEEVTYVDSGNRPSYPAYHLVDRSVLENQASPLPTGFEITPIPINQLSRLAIGSDAWKDEQDLINQIWGFTNPAGLQRKLNLWSKEKRFRDDVTIITVEIADITEGDEPCK